MHDLNEIKKLLKINKSKINKKYCLKRLGLFGSYARGENYPESDLDILAEFETPPGLEFVDLANDLEELLNIKVDLVSKNAINSRLMHYIEKDIIYV